MDVFKSLAFTDALDNHQKGKFLVVYMLLKLKLAFVRTKITK